MIWALMRRGAQRDRARPGRGDPGRAGADDLHARPDGRVRQASRCCPASPPTTTSRSSCPVGLLQGAGFTGAATGVNLARDIELGWFDRLLASPAPRPVLLAGTVLSASLRALMPMTLLLIVGLVARRRLPGPRRPADRGRCSRRRSRRSRLPTAVTLALQVQDPGGRAADAGRRLHGRAVHDRVRAAGAADRLAARRSPSTTR